MKLPEVEIVAERVHEAWRIRQLADGVVAAPSRLTGEEQLVPYAELSEPIKEYDRVLVRTVYAALLGLVEEVGAG